MGKKRIIKKGEGSSNKQTGLRDVQAGKLSRKKLEKGTLYVQATFNNTKLLLADTNGDAVAWSSSGNMGFKGARKGTPFAAAKVGEMVGEKAKAMGVKDVMVVIRGVGSGRESSVRAFVSKSGAGISKIEDRTPIPFNGPRPKKPRRV